MDPLRIAVRALATFCYLLIMLRLSGKRAVSQTTAFDFVLALIAGDLLDDFIFGDVTAAQFVVAEGTLVITDILTQLATFRSDKLQFLMDGRPTIFLKDGKPAESQLRSQLMPKQDLFALLRLKGFDEQNCDEIRLAILEDSGDPSVLRKDEAKPAQKSDKKNLKIE